MRIAFSYLSNYKRFAPLLAAPAALLLSQGQAKAILNVNIFDDGPDLKIIVSGSLASLGSNSGAATASCEGSGFLTGQFNDVYPSALCTGVDQTGTYYSVTGPAGWGGNGSTGYAGLSSVQGLNFQLYPSSYNTGSSTLPANDPYKSTYTIDSSYILGQNFFSSATFNGTSLASQGFTAKGLVGTWLITGTSESINVYVGPATVPGPLPLFGIGAAFGWTRRLRKRISSPLITPPQA
jgi:hypothetical protein